MRGLKRGSESEASETSGRDSSMDHNAWDYCVGFDTCQCCLLAGSGRIWRSAFCGVVKLSVKVE